MLFDNNYVSGSKPGVKKIPSQLFSLPEGLCAPIARIHNWVLGKGDRGPHK